MDFKDSIRQVSERIEVLKNSLPTEEATKTALVMPFISALGYDVFNPLEVLPEMCCDIGARKGEKIDYAILKDGEPVILVECKHWKQNLDLHDNQLLRYFNVSKAKFGILTNGIIYRFYTDLSKPNVMDEKPFLEVNMLELKDTQIEELKKFHKSYFDVGLIVSSAGELKYMGELRNAIGKEFADPSPDFVRFFGKQVYEGIFTPKVLEHFSSLVRRTVTNYVNDIISERLKAVMVDRPVTTNEKLGAFYIVKSILRDHLTPDRVTYRDEPSCFIVSRDENNRPICRFHFNNPGCKSVQITNSDGEWGIRHNIQCLDEIYGFKNELIDAVKIVKSPDVKSPTKGLKVTFPDGTEICGRTAIKTYVAAIKRIGYERVAALGIEHGGYNIVSRKQRPPERGHVWQCESDGWFIYSNTSNSTKVADLVRISQHYGIHLSIEEIKSREITTGCSLPEKPNFIS